MEEMKKKRKGRKIKRGVYRKTLSEKALVTES
jgi:hypothetical protein